MKTKVYKSVLLFLIGAFSTAAQTGGGYDLSHSVISGGGMKSSGGTFTVEGTIGQAIGVPIAWVKNKYVFTHVLVNNRDKNGTYDSAFRMDENPGEYEVKVLRKGKLVRTAKFSVGGHGKIVDPGITERNDLGTKRVTLFATVTGDEDGRKPDLTAWKTKAFFGAPLRVRTLRGRSVEYTRRTPCAPQKMISINFVSVRYPLANRP